MSVPYSSRCTPSETSEWGQPDCSLILTILSFYYEGLSLERLNQALDHLLTNDDPTLEFDAWVTSAQLPSSLSDLSAINVDDASQVAELWKYVRYDMRVIDYFLNNLVLPKFARQYASKLQLSGWDLPSRTKRPTVGFSGTENRALLPYTIQQKEIQELSHTNAEVLTYLLQKRNRRYLVAADTAGKSSEHTLLQMLTEKKIPILIDAGALILEMNNRDLVREWLSLWPEKRAAVYFDDFKPHVAFKKGQPVPLVASPFAEDLSDCLVYIDQASTRGTDLKLPRYSLGALTLGLSQSKDSAVQGE